MNNKIEPCYVDFNTAKLLKEKGFDEITDTIFMINHSTEVVFENINGLKHSDGNNPFISRPEQWEVIEWLRVNHGIWIYTYPVVPFADDLEYPKIVWVSKICSLKQVNFEKFIDADNGLAINHHYGPEEAYSVAIDYVLTNLT